VESDAAPHARRLRTATGSCLDGVDGQGPGGRGWSRGEGETVLGDGPGPRQVAGTGQAAARGLRSRGPYVLDPETPSSSIIDLDHDEIWMEMENGRWRSRGLVVVERIPHPHPTSVRHGTDGGSPLSQRPHDKP